MSKAVKDLQIKLEVDSDGSLGKGTAKAFMAYYKLSAEQTANFLGQCSHESGGFSLFEENLNYSADGLKRIFSKYFPTNAMAKVYERKPEKIGNRVYANRMGNGDEASGDGYKYRGRGALQTTGKSNYQALALYLKDLTLLETPELVADKYAFDSALFYFAKNKLWDIATSVSEDSITKLTKRINGGVNGLDDRIAKTKYYYSLLTN